MRQKATRSEASGAIVEYMGALTNRCAVWESMASPCGAIDFNRKQDKQITDWILEKEKKKMSEENRGSLRIPAHIAIIMDGNGRWARRRGMPRTFGHSQGAKVVEEILEDADHLGVKYLTVYAFSTENWSRPQAEVKALMNLLRRYMKSSLAKCTKNNVRVRVIGDKSMLDKDLQDAIEDLERNTASNTGIGFQIAINYGGRDEILRAVRRAAAQGLLSDPEKIDESVLEGGLDTAGIPDPDLLIRTCGEQRISNFLLWQLAYSEMYFTDKAWPEFDHEELLKAIDAYNHRERRYGGLTD